jgi:hypothetical protein
LTTLEVTDWRYRSRPDVLVDAKRFALDGLKGASVTATPIDSHIQHSVIIDPSARVDSSAVRGISGCRKRFALRGGGEVSLA